MKKTLVEIREFGSGGFDHLEEIERDLVVEVSAEELQELRTLKAQVERYEAMCKALKARQKNLGDVNWDEVTTKRPWA